MSTTYHLACTKCKRELWVGQGDRCFYTGEPETMELLRDFLWDHEYHELKFLPGNDVFDGDYVSVFFENEDEKKNPKVPRIKFEECDHRAIGVESTLYLGKCKVCNKKII